MTPTLSLVVLSYTRFATTTGPCLATLRPALDDPRCELILIDNGSPDDAAMHCAAWAAQHPQARHVALAKNLGFAGGMNAGVGLARGAWVCLVNSDTLFPTGSLDALLSTLNRVPDAVAMIGPVTNAAGNGQRLPLPEVPMAQVDRDRRRGDAHAHRLADADLPQRLLLRRDPPQRLAAARWARHRLRPRLLRGLRLQPAPARARPRAGDRRRCVHRPPRQRELRQHGLRTEGTAARQPHPAPAAPPGARLEHVRVGNAQALRHLLDVVRHSGWTDALRRRAAWRLAALRWDEPRSPFKRWRWRWATLDLRRALAAAGITAQFPAAPPTDPTP